MDTTQTTNPEQAFKEKIQTQYLRAEAYQQHWAYITYQGVPDSSLPFKQSELPLQGMTLAVKDNIDVAGMPTTAGTRALLSNVPGKDASVVSRVKNAGAVINGKANMHELAYGITSINPAFGAVANAHNPLYFAGGSSGGTAVAIALGLADAGLGTDTGGSSRIPAALNGIVGFRPTTGRYPNDGLILISETRDTVGPLAKDVSTVAKLDSVLAGESDLSLPVPDVNDVRLGVPDSYFYDELSPEVDAAMTSLLELLAQSGITLVPVDVAGLEELNNHVSFPVVMYESARHIKAIVEQRLPSMGLEDFISQISSEDVRGLVSGLYSEPTPETVYREAIEVYRPKLQQLYQQLFDDNKLDALIFPTTSRPADTIADSVTHVSVNGEMRPTFTTYIRNTDPASNAGIPGIALPIGKTDNNLPLSVELDGAAGSDRHLLAVALLIETLLSTNND
ncbi:amidase [Shewanella corallii]|uniref:Amidase n=1 Tax=Shewanella corallii TaxID=560080 RepID=A0ABT0N5X9_9GAMM|nr:amidase family protein [Shewanella corallii]MCL2913291.1 amidase [Shewanella corallii]